MVMEQEHELSSGPRVRAREIISSAGWSPLQLGHAQAVQRNSSNSAAAMIRAASSGGGATTLGGITYLTPRGAYTPPHSGTSPPSVELDSVGLLLLADERESTVMVGKPVRHSDGPSRSEDDDDEDEESDDDEDDEESDEETDDEESSDD